MSRFNGLLFALADGDGLGGRVSTALGVELAAHEVREFESGEDKIRPAESVRGRDVYVLTSLAGDDRWSANDRLCHLLFFIGALKQSSARSVTALVPYLCYSRKDRQMSPRDPVTTRYVAQLFEAVGTNRVVTVDVHNLAAFQNATRCQSEHLEATELFVDHLADLQPRGPIVVVSPDIGGVKRAERLRQRLHQRLDRTVELAFAAKLRERGLLSGPDQLLGDVAGATAVVIDDMIASGGTMRRVADMLVNQGAQTVHLLATHGLFTPDAAALFASHTIDSVAVTDSVPPGCLPSHVTGERLVTLTIAPLLAEAVARIDSGQALDLS